MESATDHLAASLGADAATENAKGGCKRKKGGKAVAPPNPQPEVMCAVFIASTPP